MKLLDRIAIHSLIKTITDFILALAKIIFPSNTNKTDVVDNKDKKRPLLDKLKKWFNK